MRRLSTTSFHLVLALASIALAACAVDPNAPSAEGKGSSNIADQPPPPSTDGDCSSATDCASCTAMSTCGWCNNHCYTGSYSGPNGASCNGASWAWLGSQCGAADASAECAAATNCGACTQLSHCGWCDGRCYDGTYSGPNGASCGSSPWSWTSDTCPAAPPAGPRLWLIFDSHQSTCQGTVEDMFACEIYATNFNDYSASFPNLDGQGAGERLTIGGSFQFDGSQCPRTHCYNGDHASNETQFQCLEDHLHLPVGPGDVILYYAPPNSEFVGCNDHYVTLNTGSGTVHVRGGTVLVEGNDSSSWCHDACCLHTHIGLHEVFEAAGAVLGDDHCIDAGSLHPTTCGAGTYWEQGVTRYGNLYSCPHPHVDVSASDPAYVCTLARAAREAGLCYGDSLVQCGVTLTNTPCEYGCTSAPTAHCELRAPRQM